jgi:Ca2+-binding RTX toxin-like protein
MAEIDGTPGNDTLAGTPLADTLRGLGGNDTLLGGGGFDQMYGGPGDDTYFIDDESGDEAIELAGEGFDSVYVAHDHSLKAGSSIELLSTNSHAATVAINLTGNELAQTLVGNAGANLLNGGGGLDTLIGLGGDDTYLVNVAGVAIGETAGGGNDAVYTSVSYTLNGGAYVELVSTNDNAATVALNLTGNELAQTLVGNNGANLFNGAGGVDTLIGLGGDDTYQVNVAGVLIGETAGGGNDAVYTSVSYTLNGGAYVELVSTNDNAATVALNLTGNELAQTLVGNNGANLMNGAGGVDTLIGLGGDDTYQVNVAGVLIGESAGGGNDAVYTSVNYTLNGGAEVELISTNDTAATVALNLIGNELAQTLVGNNGANLFNGGGGVDTLIGLGGDDTYQVNVAGVLIGEGAGGGNDAVYASVNYTLNGGAQVELISTNSHAATVALNLTGNELAQTLIGNAGASILDGKGGNDTLIGLAGADTFAFTTALGAGNVDTIADFAAGVDKILLGGNGGEPFAALASGALAAGAFVVGTAAGDANDYLIYNSSTGALLYDADGNGAGAAVQFATLSTGLSLTAADFLVSGPANAVPVVSSGAAATVAENSPATTIVYQAAATDADGDRFTWSLSGADAGQLTIDAVTGAVRLASPADFEVKTSYSFNVVASDSGSSSIAKAVTLTVTDVADNSATPIIGETSAANDAIAQAQAIDRATLAVAANPNLFDDHLPSATIQGSVSAPGDKDFFSITLQAGELLVLDVDGTTNGLDSFLTLYNPNQLVIGDNDDLVSPDPGSGIQFDHNTDSQIRFRAATSGTYYFSIESFSDDHGPTSSGSYQLQVSIGPPATPQQLIQEDVEAIQSGTSWNHLALSYGFPTLASQYPDSFKEPDNGFTPFSATQQAATRLLLQIVGTVTQLTFAESSSNPGNADLRYAMSNEADVAYAYYPTNGGPSSQGGSAWFNHTNFNTPTQGNYAWMGILHESGHAVGLKHGHEFPLAISADRDSVEYSVMTYRSYPGQDLSGGGGYTNETWSYPQTLMMYDIAALQQTYGPNYGFNNTDSVYTWNPNTGQMLINGAAGATPGGNRVFLTVWDGGGNDTYDLSGYTAADTTGTTIDLRPGEWSTTSQVQIANLGQGHFARGNIANALLYQGNSASLIENAVGSQTTDTIIANQAANHLTGNGGADTFKWMASTDAGNGGQADTIMDFVRGSDRIDLSPIDANPGTGSNDAFNFIGTAAFSHTAGELRYDVTGGSAHIFADLDGNGVADFEIVVNNVTTLAGTDFFL